MADLNDFGSALDVAKAMRRVSRREIDRQRPPSRWAIVTDIDRATRSCMVAFLGDSEEDSVRVPYTSVIPSRVGQEVKIGGPSNDRVIESIRGETEPETRLFALEDGMDVRQVMACNYGLQLDYPLTRNVQMDIPFNRAMWDPLNMADPVNGTFLIPRYGYYDINVKVGFDGSAMDTRDFLARAWIYCLPAGGGPRLELAYDAYYYYRGSDDDGALVGEISLSFSELPHLFPGDRIVVSALTNGPSGSTSGKVFANRTRINIALKYGMERYYKPEPIA
ncbi:minor tail protein [Rhodococcus phage Reynauld]|uniref:Minor tail protein n=1 Tax=Rhodococcus phage Reynauld TaxID=3062845 RepID=A0ACD4UKT3_9CAUD|nr:minor tail protein [Rhodococcus phage Reynauld]